jgi:hypothetical protein
MDALARLQVYVLAPGEYGSRRGSNYLASAWARLAKLGVRDRGIPDREGATTFSFTGTSDRALFPGLSEDERTRHKGELICPNLMLSIRRTCHGVHVVAQGSRPDRGCGGLGPGGPAGLADLRERATGHVLSPVPFRYHAPTEDMSLDIRR